MDDDLQVVGRDLAIPGRAWAKNALTDHRRAPDHWYCQCLGRAHDRWPTRVGVDRGEGVEGDRPPVVESPVANIKSEGPLVPLILERRR